jgi:transcriptional regulator with XRE-family HTH domain
LKLTQRQLASVINVTSGFIAHMETGRTLPSASTCNKLAHALGVQESVMLTAAGYLSDGHELSDEQLLEPELRVFFRDVWPRMSEDEKGMVRDFLFVFTTRVGQDMNVRTTGQLHRLGQRRAITGRPGQ